MQAKYFQANSPPSHSYLSSLRELTAADSENVMRKKREQQAAFADSLRRQIEEKERRRSKMHFTFGEENIEEKAITVEDDVVPEFQKIPECPEPQKALQRRQIFTKADLSQFDNFQRRNTINISQTSPFANSTVPTPPQGFSVRAAPKVVEQPKTIQYLQNAEKREKIPVKMLEQPKKFQYSPPKTRAKSMFCEIPEKTRQRLTGQSELVYPDGHISPVNTPRE